MNKKISSVFVLNHILLCISIITYSQDFPEILKLKADQDNQYSAFGSSLVMQGDFIIIGAETETLDSQEENELNNAGAVYVFKKNNRGDFIQSQKLISSTRERDGRFGKSLAIGDDFLFIGSTNSKIENNMSAGIGAVYIFHKNDDELWKEIQVLNGPLNNRGESFGWDIALNYPYVIISAPFEVLDNGVGAVYIFKHQNSSWTQTQKIQPTDEFTSVLGNSIAIDGDILVIGAHQSDDNNINNSGKVLIYTKNYEGSWNYHQTLFASENDEGHYFGEKVAISEGDIIVSNNIREGAATFEDNLYYFQKNGSSWYQKQIIAESEFHISDIAIKDETLFIGSAFNSNQYGSVFLYEKDESDNWTYKEEIIPSEQSSEQFGTSLNLYEEYLIVGSIVGQNAYLYGHPNVNTNILSFEFPDIETETTIDYNNHIINVTISDVPSLELAPNIVLSDDATIEPSQNEIQDFSKEVIYRVTAEDQISSQEWIVTISNLIISSTSQKLKDLKIFPNPTVDYIHIESNEKFKYSLYDLNGKLYDFGTNKNVNLSRLSNGKYVIIITTNTTKEKIAFPIIKK